MPAAPPPSASADPAAPAAPPTPPAAGWSARLRSASQSSGARRGGLALVDQGLVSATNFLTGVLVGKFGGAEALGVYTLCFMLVFFVAELQQRMLATPYMVFLHRQRGDRLSALLGSTLVHLTISSAIASLAFAAYGTYLTATQGASPMAVGVVVLTVVAPVFLLREFLRNVAFAHMQLRSAVVGDAVVLVVQLTLLAVLAWSQLMTAPAVFAVVGIATGLSCVAWVVARPQPVSLRTRRVRAHWRRHWNYSRWLVIGRVVGSFSRVAMPWIILALADKATVGQFAACHGLVGVSWLFIRGVTNYLRPLTIAAYARGGRSELLRIMWQGIALFAVTLGAMAVVLWACGGWLLTVVYRPEYAVAAAAVTVLGLNAVVTSIGMTVGNALSAVHDTRSQFWGEVVTLVVTLSSALPLVRAYGVTGAAWSLLAGVAASLVFMSVRLARDLRLAPTAQAS